MLDEVTRFLFILKYMQLLGLLLKIQQYIYLMMQQVFIHSKVLSLLELLLRTQQYLNLMKQQGFYSL